MYCRSDLVNHDLLLCVCSCLDFLVNAFYTELPALKNENVVEPGSEMGTVTFPFRHAVMETGLLVDVSPSPVNSTCGSTLSEMAVIVSCSDLTNNEGYTVTLRGTLSVEETLLPFTFSETLYPTAGLWLKGCMDASCTSFLLVRTCTPAVSITCMCDQHFLYLCLVL